MCVCVYVCIRFLKTYTKKNRHSLQTMLSTYYLTYGKKKDRIPYQILPKIRLNHVYTRMAGIDSMVVVQGYEREIIYSPEWQERAPTVIISIINLFVRCKPSIMRLYPNIDLSRVPWGQIAFSKYCNKCGNEIQKDSKVELFGTLDCECPSHFHLRGVSWSISNVRARRAWYSSIITAGLVMKSRYQKYHSAAARVKMKEDRIESNIVVMKKTWSRADLCCLVTLGEITWSNTNRYVKHRCIKKFR